MSDPTWDEFNHLITNHPRYKKVAEFLVRTLDFRYVDLTTLQLAVRWVADSLSLYEPVPPDDVLQKACDKVREIIDTADTEPGPNRVQARALIGSTEDAAGESDAETNDPTPWDEKQFEDKAVEFYLALRDRRISTIKEGDGTWGLWSFDPVSKELRHPKVAAVSLSNLTTEAAIGAKVYALANRRLSEVHPSDIGYLVRAVVELVDLGFSERAS